MSLSSIRISIVIPTLNEEKLLERTLASFPVALRTQFGVEIIVSDGGSDDRTVEIALNHGATTVQHSETRKQTIAEGRNRGAEIALGETLVFLNGDTFPAAPFEFLQAVGNWNSRMGKYGKVNAIACAVEIPPNEQTPGDRLFHWFYNGYSWWLNVIGLGMGRGECQIVRRATFHSVGGYQASLAAGEDFDLFRRIRATESIAFAGDLLVYESPRRYRKLGYTRVLWLWFINAMAVILKGQSADKEWEQVR